ncbi:MULTISPECIES: ATP-binding protein [unclassified Neglectibacter]|uniref:HAMP domain-containing sensor histidine kinase n=1 Tax=unclassified Neglectibacter TaxID=2632164 RepID=UPI001367E533|nr:MULTISPECIES: ATP-binding protein [unclassified Neglectibacter]
MIRKIRSSLSAKVFLMTAVLMAVCCSITYFCITQFAPYIYTHDFSTIDEELPYFVEDISRFTKEEALSVIEDYCNQIVEKNDDEFVFHLFQSNNEELKQFNNNDTSQWCRLTFTDSTEEYIVFFSKNTEKESQVVEALQKAIPVLSVVIIVVSIIAAFFYTIYMTTPIKKISRISKQMAALDFNGLCTVRRTDEIGVLADSLNDLSRKLSSALSELQSANQKLQADIDMERQLERQRVEFFSAASHELKTPITIIKGQLQGMLYQVGRYKDRETYLAQSLEVTDNLERMVQELLTISRLDTPRYAFNPSHIHFDKLIKDRLAANEDLFMQHELTVEKDISSEVSISGDLQLLQKVVDNLLGNAAAYSPAGEYITVKVCRADEKAHLTIENTGVHIPDEDIPKLFEAFYRVDQSRNRQTGGTGLGLYIVKTILDLHGAAIKIENTAQGVMVSVQF